MVDGEIMRCDSGPIIFSDMHMSQGIYYVLLYCDGGLGHFSTGQMTIKN